MSPTSHTLDAVRVQHSALRMVGGAGGDGERSSLQQRIVLKVTAQQVDGPADETQRFEMLHAFGSFHGRAAGAALGTCVQPSSSSLSSVRRLMNCRQAAAVNMYRAKCGISNDLPVLRAHRCRGYRIWGGGAVQRKWKGKRRGQGT